MRYFLYEEQSSGCDYTIGCGMRLEEIEGVKSMEEAIRMVTALNPPPGEDLECDARIITEGECALDYAEILAVSEVREINLESLRAERRALRKQVEESSQDELDRKEYKRLRKKFRG